ncbi:MAG: 1-deoxy-D-xylulose-5-phosphate synthase [Chlorobi bacterium]|nr:1-deoxy-D-xylulose-5-phosphate synthase [Chlorobiota bacterium]
MSSGKKQLLTSIDDPADLRQLTTDQLPQVCKELRQFIIDAVSENPGHFASSLGVVELTVALHYAYQTPYDLLVWDVGHQAYGHKILTGRREKFHTNRKLGGISGFPTREESIYDTFGVGHSSTSISAALGMAIASQRQKEDRKVVAVIGDGALSAGLAFEGMNNAGAQNADLLVVLNDNRMSIDPNVGALKEYLLDITTSPTYNKIKNDIWNWLGIISKVAPKTRLLAQQVEHALKTSLFQHSNLFESLNFRYFGPVDGHDVIYLTQLFNDLQNIKGPKLLHVVTKKGKGFQRAEMDATLFHAPPGQFDKTSGKIFIIHKEKDSPVKYQEVFGQTMIELAEQNPAIVAITPAMPTGSRLSLMAEKFPDRTFDVGIAEQHAVTFAAGMATRGLLPYCTIYSTFLQRAMDQVIHDVAIQNLPVIFCIDRGGLVGHDGSTHHGVFDMAYLRSIPNMTVTAPMDEVELRNLLYTAQKNISGPFAIRYPRSLGVISKWKQPFREIPAGTARIISDGTDLAILSIGHPGNDVRDAAQKLSLAGYSILHYDMRFVKPLDEKVLQRVGKNFRHVITVEDGVISGGFGSAVMEFFNDHHYTVNVTRLGIPDQFIRHGKPDELHRLCGFDSRGIYDTALQILLHEVKHPSGEEIY